MVDGEFQTLGAGLFFAQSHSGKCRNGKHHTRYACVIRGTFVAFQDVAGNDMPFIFKRRYKVYCPTNTVELVEEAEERCSSLQKSKGMRDENYRTTGSTGFDSGAALP